ncbi:MAG: preprotein translocase subunit SecG [Candidatus Scalindua sp.]
MKLKWITAIVIVFGILAMFYAFHWSGVLKTTLILSCIVLIGCVLLQAGKGGGLAAIGGLADESALGTQPGGVLAKVTYLVGAIFIVSTLLLTKLTLSSIHGTDTLRGEMSTLLQESAPDHSGHEGTTVIKELAGHDHSQDTSGDVEVEGVGGATMGMKAVDVTDTEQKSEEN